MTGDERQLEEAARTLADRVMFDCFGRDGRGGHGGLVSDDTIRAANEVNRVLARHQIGRKGNRS